MKQIQRNIFIALLFAILVSQIQAQDEIVLEYCPDNTPQQSDYQCPCPNSTLNEVQTTAQDGEVTSQYFCQCKAGYTQGETDGIAICSINSATVSAFYQGIDTLYNWSTQIQDQENTGGDVSYYNDGSGPCQDCVSSMTCSCNQIVGQCEYRCCCDPDCIADTTNPTQASNLVKRWSEQKVCLQEDVNEICINPVEIYRINEYRGMVQKTDANTGEICVQSDNQAEYSTYIADNIDHKQTNNSKNIAAAYHNEILNSIAQKITRNESSTGDLKMLPYPNAFGECVKNRVITQNIDIPIQKCTVPVTIDECTPEGKLGWWGNKSFLSSEIIDITGDNENSDTATITYYKYANQKYTKTSDEALYLTAQDGDNCKNPIKAITFNVLDNNQYRAQVFIGEDINVTQISSTEIMFGVLFTQSDNGNMFVSGFPGYVHGKRVLGFTRTQETVGQATTTNYTFMKHGVYMQGLQDSDNQCQIGTTESTLYNPFTDNILEFGQDMTLQCIYNKNLAQGQSITLFENFKNNERYFGKIGSSNLQYANDWVTPNSVTHNGQNTMIVTIYYKQVGFQLNLQNQIFSIAVSFRNDESRDYTTDEVDGDGNIVVKTSYQLQIRFINFLVDEIENEYPASPTAMPQFPYDLFFPVWYEEGYRIQFNFIIFSILCIVLIFN